MISLLHFFHFIRVPLKKFRLEKHNLKLLSDAKLQLINQYLLRREEVRGKEEEKEAQVGAEQW